MTVLVATQKARLDVVDWLPHGETEPGMYGTVSVLSGQSRQEWLTCGHRARRDVGMGVHEYRGRYEPAQGSRLVAPAILSAETDTRACRKV